MRRRTRGSARIETCSFRGCSTAIAVAKKKIEGLSAQCVEVKLLGYCLTLQTVIKSSAKRKLDFLLGSGTVLSVIYAHCPKKLSKEICKLAIIRLRHERSHSFQRIKLPDRPAVLGYPTAHGWSRLLASAAPQSAPRSVPCRLRRSRRPASSCRRPSLAPASGLSSWRRPSFPSRRNAAG